MSHLSKLDTGQAEVADVSARPPADGTAIVFAHFELLRSLLFFHECFLWHFRPVMIPWAGNLGSGLGISG